MQCDRIGLAALIVASGICLPFAQSAEFEWIPVSASGPADPPVGNAITLHGGGQSVTLEVWLSDWDPDLNGDPHLGTYQITLDSAGYSSGSGLPLGPLHGCCPGDPSDAFVNTLHPDFVFGGMPSPCFPIPATNIVTLNYQMGSSILGGCSIPDDGAARYGATLILDVPFGAVGTYTIRFVDASVATFMRDENGSPITPLNLTPAMITVLCVDNAECDDQNACTEDACEPDGTCSHVNTYDDQVFCCDPQSGNLEPIDDGNDCTEDICNPDGSVSHIPVPGGSPCDGPPIDACDAQNTCDEFGNCTDQFAPPGEPCGSQADTDCTAPDTCDGGGSCEPNHEPDGTACGDPSDTDCTDPDTCNGLGGCSPNHAPNGTTCDDDLYCTVDEFCTAGSCGNGDFTCNDGIGCTDDTCDEDNDTCANDPNDANCDNNQWCDGFEWCHATNDCQPGTAPDCGDGVDCTDDVCSELNDICVNTPNDANCDNGLWCDGFESCDAEFDCQDGEAPDCNDGIDCTVDSCNEIADECVNAPDDEQCPDDTLFCNGEEICVVGVGCDHSGSPCNGPCDEENDTCLCDAPIVEVVGPRYLAISLQPPTSGPQAIVVQAACSAGTPRYVGALEPFYIEGPFEPPVQLGLLVDDPADAIFLTPFEWGSPVYVTGAALAPATTHHIWADCGMPGDPAFSDSTTVLTWKMSDVDYNEVVNLTDVQFTVLGFEGRLPDLDVTLASTDTATCEPDRLLNMTDVQWAVLTFEGILDPLDLCTFDCPQCHPADCDDLNACTDDGCDIETGLCWNTPNYDPLTECCNPTTGATTPTEDGDLCTNDTCDDATGEVSHTPMNCVDSDDCTLDECVEGNCVNTNYGAIPCEDNGDCPPTSSYCSTGGWCTCPGLPAATFELQPIGSNGPFEIDGREIIIPAGGVTVTVELILYDWDRNHDSDPMVGTYQGTIDRESLTSGSSGSLSLAEIPCETNEDCSEGPVSQPASICEADNTCDLYAAFYVQQDDPDYIFFDSTTITVTTPYHPEYWAWGSAILLGDGASDTGDKMYGGTIILDVSPGASGTFTLALDPSGNYTFMNELAGYRIGPTSTWPAYITISGD